MLALSQVITYSGTQIEKATQQKETQQTTQQKPRTQRKAITSKIAQIKFKRMIKNMDMKKDIEQLINKFDLAITIQLNKTDLNYTQIENKKNELLEKLFFILTMYGTEEIKIKNKSIDNIISELIKR